MHKDAIIPRRIFRSLANRDGIGNARPHRRQVPGRGEIRVSQSSGDRHERNPINPQRVFWELSRRLAEHWREWSDPRLIILVLANRDLNMVTWEQRVTAGDPKFAASQVVPAFGFARYADMIGLEGIRVELPEQIGPALDRALAATRPVVLEAITDPEVPILPPHITVEQARKLVGSILEGDPSRGAMIRGAFKEALKSFLPHSKS